MTLVATLAPDNYPLLISDLLLSGNETVGYNLNIPTIGAIDAVFPEGSGYLPSRLIQKAVIINDNFVIGWSGKRIVAKVVIKELMEANSERAFTFNSLGNTLNQQIHRELYLPD